MLNKLRKSKKGFTLIELIVVIAILGILAAIAIPRFAGFTSKAKVAADDQYIALYTNAVSVLLADGTITGISAAPATNIVTIAGSTGLPTLGAGLLGSPAAADFTSLVKQTSLKFFTSVVITVTNADGTCTVAYTPARP